METCKDTEQKIISDNDIRLYDTKVQQLDALEKLALSKRIDVPVLIITRSPAAVDEIYQRISLLAGVEEGHVQKLLEVEGGVHMGKQWGDIIDKSTLPVGEDGSRLWRITVTDYFGGRGIDYKVSDELVNEAGGLMVIMTGIPESEREWVQWIGRTGRQDKNGQYSVLMHKEADGDDFVSANLDLFNLEAVQQEKAIIQQLLGKRNEAVKETLQGHADSLQKGARTNEVCEEFYTSVGGLSAGWPANDADRALREFLTAFKRSERDVSEFRQRHIPEGSSVRWEFNGRRFSEDEWSAYSQDHQRQLRERYHAKPPTAIFQLERWEINFVQMTQKNIETGKVRAIRARSGADFLPPVVVNGGKTRHQKLVVHFRPVDEGGPDWKRLEAQVRLSLPRHRVTKLVEIQNSELRADYEHCRSMVDDRLDAGDGTTTCIEGFHAMAGNPKELEKIYNGGRDRGGFDFRLSRKGSYGRGSYFAKHAVYSAYFYPRPTPTADGSITMLVAEVRLKNSFSCSFRLPAVLLPFGRR